MGDTAGAAEHERHDVVEHEVDPQNDARGDRDHVEKERRQEDRHPDDVAGKPHEVEAEDPRDRARGADQGHVRRREDEGVEEGCRGAGGEVGGDVGARSQAALDVVAVDPEKEHVAEEV
jgi:hypothetical protein